MAPPRPPQSRQSLRLLCSFRLLRALGPHPRAQARKEKHASRCCFTDVSWKSRAQAGGLRRGLPLTTYFWRLQSARSSAASWSKRLAKTIHGAGCLHGNSDAGSQHGGGHHVALGGEQQDELDNGLVGDAELQPPICRMARVEGTSAGASSCLRAGEF